MSMGGGSSRDKLQSDINVTPLVDVCLVLAVAVLWFQVPLRGSVTLLFALTLVYLMSTLGLGLFVSTISSAQQQAMMTTIFFFLMPMIYLSGFIFPIENMPAVIQPPSTPCSTGLPFPRNALPRPTGSS